MPAKGLLLIAPVRAGFEEGLRITLNRFGNDIRGTHSDDVATAPRIHFTRSQTIHFARFALIDDPERGPNRKRLLFATDYDGPWDAHVREIIALTQRPEAIWGCCEGYSGPEHFAEFVRRHTITPQTHYLAFRGTELERLREVIRIRDQFQGWLSEPDTGRSRWALPDLLFIGKAVHDALRAVKEPLDAVRRWTLAIFELVRLMVRLGLREVVQAALQINATINRVGWIRVTNQLFRNTATAPPSNYSQADSLSPPNPTPSGYPPEDAILQNQLTLVTDVRPEHLPRLRAVLALIDLHGRRLSSSGTLVGISTIHTVRWTLIDGDKRLLMVSNYDGTWENYIDEFAEMILSGLDALWTPASDYPRAGAQDVAALKQFLRRHQAPANVFYSAYPESSVLNLKDDVEFAKWFGWIFRVLDGDETNKGDPSRLPSTL